MAQNKTQPTEASVIQFINAVENPKRRADALVVYQMMNEISPVPAKMWGPSLIGYDTYHYKYESGREGDFFKIGFSPRKQATTIYLMSGFEKNKEILERLGKHKVSKACLYINKLDDVNLDVLKELVQHIYNEMTKKYG